MFICTGASETGLVRFGVTAGTVGATVGQSGAGVVLGSGNASISDSIGNGSSTTSSVSICGGSDSPSGSCSVARRRLASKQAFFGRPIFL